MTGNEKRPPNEEIVLWCALGWFTANYLFKQTLFMVLIDAYGYSPCGTFRSRVSCRCFSDMGVFKLMHGVRQLGCPDTCSLKLTDTPSRQHSSFKIKLAYLIVKSI